ncbi:calcium-binding protein [Yersinia rohdei]|uniref:calcium-binding protein n=1 Tax=Yersinia rohdei TaxID=29485 RepID=UPI0011A0D663|nr:calcium-binding protein [Yersinia rohdei]
MSYNANLINGSDENDHLAGGDSDDIIFGYASFDSLFGQGGNDILVGGTGNDGLAGGAGNDFIDAGDGDDELYGDANGLGPFAYQSEARGNDILFGGKGLDRIEGGRNNDYLAGGTGDDMYLFSSFEGINMIVEYGGEKNTICINDYFLHELKFKRYGNHLMISSAEAHINNLTIVIYDQYAEDGYKVNNLETRSYIKYSSEEDKKYHENNILTMVKNNLGNTDDILNKLTHEYDLGDIYRTDLTYVFSSKMPDTEKLTKETLIDVLKDRNDKLQNMYENNPLHFGDNLPDISYISAALSSFAPKEAQQAYPTYLKHHYMLENSVYNSLLV